MIPVPGFTRNLSGEVIFISKIIYLVISRFYAPNFKTRQFRRNANNRVISHISDYYTIKSGLNSSLIIIISDKNI